MMEIKALVQPFMVEKVLRALTQIEGLPGLTVSQVFGWGATRAADAQDPVHESGHSFVRKTKLEIVVADELVPVVVEAITKAAHTGRYGDGKIFVSEVSDVVRVRTGERGESAISR